MIQAIDGINAQKWVLLNLKLPFISDNFKDDISSLLFEKIGISCLLNTLQVNY